MFKVKNPRLFQVGQNFCIIDMPLGVKITVSNFNKVEEVEVCHPLDYTLICPRSLVKRRSCKGKRTNVRTIELPGMIFPLKL
jgi:hypothetical protein